MIALKVLNIFADLVIRNNYFVIIGIAANVVFIQSQPASDMQ